MRVTLIILTLMLSSSSAYAACYTNAMGRVVCNNGQISGGYNANRGTARTSETNQYGITTSRQVREEKPRLRMVRGFIRAQVANTAISWQIVTVAGEEVTVHLKHFVIPLSGTGLTLVQVHLCHPRGACPRRGWLPREGSLDPRRPLRPL